MDIKNNLNQRFPFMEFGAYESFYLTLITTFYKNITGDLIRPIKAAKLSSYFAI